MLTSLIPLLVAFIPQSQFASKDAAGKVVGFQPTKAQIERARQAKGRAPSIVTTDSTGKPIKLASFLGKPVILAFFERDCPYSRMAKSYYDNLQFFYRSEVTVLGVIDANQEDAGEWVEAAAPRFRLSLDPKLETAKAYGAEAGLYTVLIKADGTIAKAWAGFSQPMFAEMTERISKMPGVHHKGALQIKAAPAKLTCGNLLKPMDEKKDHE